MKHCFSGHARRLGRVALLSMGCLFSLPQLQAQNLFQIESGSWHESTLWSTGSVPVSGEEVRIGGFTPLTATISSGDAASGNTYLAYSSGESGSVTVDNGRVWNSETLYVGLGGTGSLLVQGGSQVNDVEGAVGNDAGAHGTATVTGAGSLWSHSNSLAIGGDGNGTLNVENGGAVTSSYTSVGWNGTGLATVTGTGSRLEATGGMSFGGSGTGTLTVSAGGKVSAGIEYDISYFGYGTDGIGKATVTGANSLLEVKGILILGNYGQGSLNIENGGKVTSSYDAYIGNFEGGRGEVTVSGSNSQWTLASMLQVGFYGNGTLNIEKGGKVVTTEGSVIGSVGGSTGTVTVTGSNSLWQNNHGLSVGDSGNGTLNVTAGGKVTVAGENTYIGYFGEGTGVVTVTGSGSLMQNSKQLILGSMGDGSLNVADGGKVTASSVTLGFDPDFTSKGTVTLSGIVGSRGVLETSYVGKSTAPSKLHFDGGVLRATRTQTNFLQDFAAGDVQIHDGGAFIDTNGFNVTISTRLQNAAGKTGGLTKLGGGRLTLSGTSTYTGVTSIEAGSLRVSGRLTGGVAIKQGATLDGTGTLGAVTVERGGTIAPGNSAGTLNTGSQIWNGGGIYLWEVNAATGTPGTTWDLLNVNGKLTLASTVGDPFYIALKGTLSGLNPLTIYTWKILTASDGFDSSFNANKIAFDLTRFTGLPDGMAFSVFTQNKDLMLKLEAVPEPGQVALVLTAVGSLLAFGRRKR